MGLCFDANMKICDPKILDNTLSKSMKAIFIEEQETQIVETGDKYWCFQFTPLIPF